MMYAPLIRHEWEMKGRWDRDKWLPLFHQSERSPSICSNLNDIKILNCFVLAGLELHDKQPEGDLVLHADARCNCSELKTTHTRFQDPSHRWSDFTDSLSNRFRVMQNYAELGGVCFITEWNICTLLQGPWCQRWGRRARSSAVLLDERFIFSPLAERRWLRSINNESRRPRPGRRLKSNEMW